MRRPARVRPLVLLEEHLGDVAGRGHEVDLHSRQIRSNAVDTADAICPLLPPGRRRVDPDDIEPLAGEPVRRAAEGRLHELDLGAVRTTSTRQHRS